MWQISREVLQFAKDRGFDLGDTGFDEVKGVGDREFGKAVKEGDDDSFLSIREGLGDGMEAFEFLEMGFGGILTIRIILKQIVG